MKTTDPFKSVRSNGIKMTDKELLVLKLKDQEKLTWVQVGKRMKCRADTSRQTYRRAKKKFEAGLDPENCSDDRAALLVDQLTQADVKLASIAEKTGFPLTVLTAFKKRLRTQWDPLRREIVKLKRDQLIELYEQKAQRCLEFMDDYAMGTASLKDLAIASGVMLDKSLLLRGEPTQIMSHQQRKRLDELAPALIAEMQRRGLPIELKQQPDGSYEAEE